MATDFSYVITLKNDTSKSSSGAVAGQKNNAPQKPIFGGTESSQVVGATLVAWSKVKPWVNRVVSHEVSMVELRTGSKELQEKANFTYSLINTGVSALESMATGFFVSGGNPIGAVIGLATSGIAKLVNIAQNQNRINTERAVENISVRQNLVRAGARGSR